MLIAIMLRCLPKYYLNQSTNILDTLYSNHGFINNNIFLQADVLNALVVAIFFLTKKLVKSLIKRKYYHNIRN